MNPHDFHRKIAARNMAMTLVVETGARMPRYSYRNVVRHALDFARGLTADQWLALGQRAGHYVAGGTVADETRDEVLEVLGELIPDAQDVVLVTEAAPAPAAERDPFDFSRGVLG
jgi:hypothetical protein